MKQKKMDSDKSGIQVISRAARVLGTLKDHPQGLSLGQISTNINLPRSTVQRIVGALQAERLLIANMAGGGVRLGPELGALAQAAQFDTAEQCRPLLVELTKATSETSDLSVLRGGKMIFIDQVPGTHRLRTVSSVGEAFPLTTTANGRASLAKLPRAEAMALAKAEAAQMKTDMNLDSFEAQLDEINGSGLAFDLDEHSNGISAIGFAFVDPSNAIHAISLPTPSARFVQQREKIEAAVHRARDMIAQTLQT